MAPDYVTYAEWARRIREHFEPCFWSDGCHGDGGYHGYYKDTFNSSGMLGTVNFTTFT